MLVTGALYIAATVCLAIFMATLACSKSGRADMSDKEDV